jgi:hypothetical protein
VAVDAGHIYWTNLTGGSIGRANLDGSEVEQNFITTTYPAGVAAGPEGPPSAASG